MLSKQKSQNIAQNLSRHKVQWWNNWLKELPFLNNISQGYELASSTTQLCSVYCKMRWKGNQWVPPTTTIKKIATERVTREISKLTIGQLVLAIGKLVNGRNDSIYSTENRSLSWNVRLTALISSVATKCWKQIFISSVAITRNISRLSTTLHGTCFQDINITAINPWGEGISRNRKAYFASVLFRWLF